MPDFEMNLNVENLAKEIGDSLVARLKDYLKDASDTEFLKEIALEMANLQYQAATAVSQVEREAAKQDMSFMHARVDTFVARQAIKFSDATQDAVKEIFATVVEILGAVAGAALKGMLG